MDVNPTLPILSRHRKDHTESEWTDIRPYFTELYLLQKKPLAEASRILREQHGFAATDKQYKDRVKKWGLRKNFKAKEKNQALAAGITSTTDQVVTHKGLQIPERRLRRWARDEKLQYVERAAGHLPLMPSVPTPNYDIVVELPREMISQISTPRAVHAGLQALEEVSKSRYPILKFSVLGISDAHVRYGLSYDKRGASGVVIRTLPVALGTRRGKPVKVHGITFESSSPAALQHYGQPPTNRTHLDLLRFMCQKIFPMAQHKFSPDARCLDEMEGDTLLPVYNPHAGIRIPTFRTTPTIAMTLYLHLMAHGAVGAAARFIYEGISYLEMATDFVGGDRPRLIEEPTGRSTVSDSTIGHNAEVKMDIQMLSKKVFGVITIPRRVGSAEAVNPRTAPEIPPLAILHSLSAEAPVVLSAEPQFDHYLLDPDDNTASIEWEFRAAAQRAAKALHR